MKHGCNGKAGKFTMIINKFNGNTCLMNGFGHLIKAVAVAFAFWANEKGHVRCDFCNFRM